MNWRLTISGRLRPMWRVLIEHMRRSMVGKFDGGWGNFCVSLRSREGLADTKCTVRFFFRIVTTNCDTGYGGQDGMAFTAKRTSSQFGWLFSWLSMNLRANH
jgi:hypothetical protein